MRNIKKGALLLLSIFAIVWISSCAKKSRVINSNIKQGSNKISNQTPDDNQDTNIKNISLKTNETDLLTISTKIMQKYLDEFKNNTLSKQQMISDYKINKISELQGNNDAFNFFVDYSLKPADLKSYLLCGNGKIDGAWIVNKNAFVQIEKVGDTYKIKDIGTGR